MPVENAITDKKSSYLQYLPAIYRDDALMGEFLLIFESILTPIEHMIDNISYYFDPSIVPDTFLAWLASWLYLSIDPVWPQDRRRELIKSAAELYRWRGTRWGLSEFLRIYTGIEPEIREYMPGMALDSDTKLGLETQLGSGTNWSHLHIILPIDNKGVKIDDIKIRTIIEAQKPAHCSYSLEFA